jgi:oligopeptide transport system substrate-binding protein
MMIVLLAVSASKLANAADPITVHIHLPTTNNLDPVSLLRREIGGRTLAENLFVGLTRFDASTGTVQPMLASTWTISDDKLTYTFTLRKDIQWVQFDPSTEQIKTVRPIVANDFVYALSRACDPALPNPEVHTVYIIKGCRKIAMTNPDFVDPLFIERELGVHTLSDDVLVIKLEFNAPYFPTILTLPEFRPVPKEAIEKDADWTKANVIMTSGPFALQSWNRDIQTVNLIRNPYWPDKPVGNIARIEAAFGATSNTIVEAMTNGSADFAILDGSSTQALKKAKPELFKSAIGQRVTVLGFSIERTPVQKESFRRALSQALDRQALVDQLLPDIAAPISRFTPSAQPDNRGYDASSAQSALVEAGFPGCKLKEKIDFLIDDQPESTVIAQALLAKWNTVLGCNESTFTVTSQPTDYVQRIVHGLIDTSEKDAKPRPAMWLYTWTPDYPDVNAYTGDTIHCQYGYLRTNTPCGDAEIAVDYGAIEMDASRRADYYAQADAIWFGDAGTFPVIPLYVSLNSAAIQPTLTTTTVNPPHWFESWILKR